MCVADARNVAADERGLTRMEDHAPVPLKGVGVVQT